MIKLKLKIEDIDVTGFELLPPATGNAGTVQGAEALTRYTYCYQDTCFQTCDQATCLC
jgi:hypothetical protein